MDSMNLVFFWRNIKHSEIPNDLPDFATRFASNWDSVTSCSIFVAVNCSWSSNWMNRTGKKKRAPATFRQIAVRHIARCDYLLSCFFVRCLTENTWVWEMCVCVLGQFNWFYSCYSPCHKHADHWNVCNIFWYAFFFNRWTGSSMISSNTHE